MISILITVLFISITSANIYEQNTHCEDLRPQTSVDMSQIMGMWYGIEYIDHGKENGLYDSCPIIHLSDTTYESTGIDTYSQSNYYAMGSTERYLRPGDQGYNWEEVGYPQEYSVKEYRTLRLLWEDRATSDIEYQLRYNNSRRGFWVSSAPHSGSRGSLVPHQYEKFAGTIQVLKAVSDHLVLTFCQKYPSPQLFTVILAREPMQLGRQVISSIHNLLERKSLSTWRTNRICNGSCIIQINGIQLVMATLIMLLISYFRSNKM